MKYSNPIIAGFHPDPSICRVGEDYYLVNSTFEYFPGIPVFHSKDLVNWKQIGHCITRNSQLTLRKGIPNCTGIYAATIRYHNGIFYVITTNVSYGGADDGNFFVWTKDPGGDWSDPVWLDFPGIDPSLFFDEDGKVYYTGTSGQIFLSEIDLTTGKQIGERKDIWVGTGGNDPEGPHIYKRGEWYYLFISEGGTEYGHMVTVARGRNIEGPYESCPYNPVLTNRSHSLPIKAVGHLDITQDINGYWWAVCLGIRVISYPFRHNLGRETMLLPMDWSDDGWPVMGRSGLLDESIETLLLTEEQESQKEYHYFDNFNEEVLDFGWNFIYNSIEELYSLDQGKGLILKGNENSLSEADTIAWIGRRQEHHQCRVRTKLLFLCSEEGEEAGLTIYMNHQHHYEIAIMVIDCERRLIFRRQIGSLWKIEHSMLCESSEIILEIEASKEQYTFRYSMDGKEFFSFGQGEATYLTTEVGGRFTGNYIGLYAVGNGKKCKDEACFQWYSYKSLN